MAEQYPGGGRGSGSHKDPNERAASKEQMMNSVRDASQQDRRVYVGNLSYDVRWHHLKDFMRQAGDVIFANVLQLPSGMSKGCGIVEYATREEAQQAVNTLSNQNLMGRLVYVREDREAEPRFDDAQATRPIGGPQGGPAYPPRGGGYGGGAGGYHGGAGGGGVGKQIYVSGLPHGIGWQDLKDFFRQAGSIIRADVHQDPAGRPKNSGIVLFEFPDDAQNAIRQFNGYEWNGRYIEVREDRYASAGGPAHGGYGGGPPMGGFAPRGGYGGDRGGYGHPRGGFGVGRGGFAPRGGYGAGNFGPARGGYGGGGGGGSFGAPGGHGPASFPSQSHTPAPPNPFTDFASSGGERGATIFVRNLPWTTQDDDLVELFQTISKVEQAEICREAGGRSRGTGVVRMDSVEAAETAIDKFGGYDYGQRPLGITFVRYTNQGGSTSGSVGGATGEATGAMDNGAGADAGTAGTAMNVDQEDVV